MLAMQYPKHVGRQWLLINVSQQRLYYLKDQKLKADYPISSAKNGTGCEENSGKTPLGGHFIREKIGDNAPFCANFKGRKLTGEIPEILTQANQTYDADYITSRILWLSGLDTDYNLGSGVDSYQRYIYIHGTAEEGRLGEPVSHGCIRMANHDIIELYDRVTVDSLVYIYEQ